MVSLKQFVTVVINFLFITGLNLFLKQADDIEFLDRYAKTSRDFGELCTVLQWNKQQRTNNVVNI